MGVWIYSLEVGGISLYDATYNFPMILIAGGEDKGVGKSILSISDVVVSIPMFGKINSLNVASSVAIALSWINRVRGKENG
jgi:23S rRNA (guanosine2251-2'-O)-methyltransferase